MDTFLNWFGPIVALCIGVMMLAVFFTALAWVKDRLSPSRSIKIKGFLNKTDRVTLHLSRGETLENVRFVGFTDPSSFKGGIPYQLSNMVILESHSGERILLRADSIRSIRQLNGEPAVAPNGGPAKRLGHSGVAEGPPSVS
jgi:hypothetical protein